MPAPRKQDKPLSSIVSARLPEDVATRWKAAAEAAHLNFSDWLRQAVDGGRVVITGKPTPRRRPKLKAPSGADPELLRQLASLGNNLNQIARMVNRSALAGQPLDMIDLLAALRGIESRLENIASGGAGEGA